jgi:DNA polymerase-4
LFVRLYQRRMLIRLIGVKLSHLVRGTPQLNLFEDTPEMVRLYQEIDRMRNRYGRKSVIRAVGMGNQ